MRLSWSCPTHPLTPGRATGGDLSLKFVPRVGVFAQPPGFFQDFGQGGRNGGAMEYWGGGGGGQTGMILLKANADLTN